MDTAALTSQRKPNKSTNEKHIIMTTALPLKTESRISPDCLNIKGFFTHTDHFDFVAFSVLQLQYMY